MTLQEIVEQRKWREDISDIVSNIEKRLLRQMPDGSKFRFTALQEEALQEPTFWEDWEEVNAPNLIIQGATSAGKTLLSELNILDCLNQNRTAIVLVPLKSMVRERSERFMDDMRQLRHTKLGGEAYRVYGSSSDYLDFDRHLIDGDYDVGVIVYEKFFAMLSQGADILKNCGLLIIDELSMLSKEARGPKLEMAIEMARIKAPNIRIMCLVTTDCSVKKMKTWLRREKYVDEERKEPNEPDGPLGIAVISNPSRPVGLDEYLINIQSGNYLKRHIKGEVECEGKEGTQKADGKEDYGKGDEGDWDSDERDDGEGKNPICEEKINPHAQQFEKKQIILEAIIKRTRKNFPDAKILIFVATQSKTRNIAAMLTKNNSFPSVTVRSDFMRELELCEHDDDYNLLKTTIAHGIAFHHSGMAATFRELIEKEFQRKSQDCCIKTIVATETLTIGINLPVDCMILMDHEVPKGMGKDVPLTAQEYRNYIGRAGRLGQSNRCGESYILLPSEREVRIFWNSVFSENEEVISALTNASEEEQAPYYLGLLTKNQGESTDFSEDDLANLFKKSLANTCHARPLISRKLRCALYEGYLIDKKSEIGKRKKEKVKEEVKEVYALTHYGKAMSLYALSIETCADIYYYFIKREAGGLPGDVTADEINSDRYLLDILFRICMNKEIKESSNILLPAMKNPITHAKAMRTVINALNRLIDPVGKHQVRLWEESKIAGLMNEDAPDRDEMMQAAMRAIVLYYWTTGKSASEIKKEFVFQGYEQRITNGDMERMAEVVSFHLDAIYRSFSERGWDPKLGLALYILSNRVKYGVPQDLICIANRHVFGIERSRILGFGKAAQEKGLSPAEYLQKASDSEVSRYFSKIQREQILARMDNRYAVGSFNTLLDALEEGLNGDFPEREALQTVRDWNGSGREELDKLRTALNDILGSSDSDSGFGVMDYKEANVWDLKFNNEGKSFSFRFGVCTENQKDYDRLLQAFKESSHTHLKNIILTASDDRLAAINEEMPFELGMTLPVFAELLAKKCGEQGFTNRELAEMLNDMCGKFTYLPFSLRNYVMRDSDEKIGYRVLCNYNGLDKSSIGILMRALQNTTDLADYQSLPWGSELGKVNISEKPTILMLEREQILKSKSLNDYLYRLSQNQFENCMILFTDVEKEEEWNQAEGRCIAPSLKWRDIYNMINRKTTVDLDQQLAAIRAFCAGWKSSQYLIGVSYAHYSDVDFSPECQKDAEYLAALVAKLNKVFGESRILFDNNPSSKSLFHGEKRKSLDKYGECRLFLVLENDWTLESAACIEEREQIDRVRRDNPDATDCWLLQSSHSHKNWVDNLYYSSHLPESDDEREEMVDLIIARISEMSLNMAAVDK